MAYAAQSASEVGFITLRPDSIELVNENKTAIRKYKDSNNGIVFSSMPIQNDRMFLVQIDKTIRINGCNGCIEMGVITCEPTAAEMTGPAATIVNGSWVQSGDIISRNATPCIHMPNKNLNNLEEGDTCGVMRTSSGDLIFEINGECLGIVAQNMPPRIYAVMYLFGKCIQITLKPSQLRLECQQHLNDKMIRLCPVILPNVPYFSNLQLCPDFNVWVSLPLVKNGQQTLSQENFKKNSKSKLRFHQHCGNLVKLSSDRKTAERRDPLDEFNNGVVMTHRTLNDDELFEIRIDHLVNKWSGSLEVGVTIHNPLLIEFPTTMTNMHSGTIMMSGCSILINGKGNRREYGQFNLDKLREGDTVGMMRRSNGNLHYFINGLDQGVAASKIPQRVWGVIDLYGMTIKVTIIDPEERKYQNSPTQRKSSQSNFASYVDSSKRNNLNDLSSLTDRLLFHTNCGAHAVVSGGGLTAHRPHATDDFNNGVVLTNRPLRPDEVFEVRLDKVVKKWAGSIEIGVTTHAPHDLDFPITMTNMRSGTWMMTGNGVMHNGTTVQDRYGSSLDRIIVGDRVGVVRQSCGTLRFYINGIDQGPATTGVPENVYGVIDLYGQAAQASIVQFLNSPESLPSCVSNATLHGGDLCFHRSHGHNVRVQGIGLVATRIASMVNFEDALLFSSRPLRECEMFQFRVCEILELWDSCIAFGVTAANPSEITLPSTFKGITQDTYILHGRTLIHNSCYMSDKYPLNLLNISVNSRIGVMRHADRSVHFYLDGMDQGKAWDVYNLNIYAVIDLSGQCSEICMSPPKSRGFSGNSDNSLNMPTTGLQCSNITKHIFSEYCGTNIEINGDYTIARVISLTAMSNLVFSASLLHPDGLFEIEVTSCDSNFAGSMRVGVTDVNILNAYINTKLPSSMLELPPGTLYIEGNQQITIGSDQVNAIYPSLCWLKTKDRVGLRRIGYSDSIALQLNTEEIGVVFRNVPDKVFVVFELCGPQTSIRAISTDSFPCDEVEMEASDDGNSLHLIGCTSPVQNDKLNESNNVSRSDSPVHLVEAPDINNEERKCHPDTQIIIHKNPSSVFHINHGGNIIIEKQGTGVRRLTGYNRAIVIASKAILKGQSFKFQVTKLNSAWNSSLMVGASRSALALRLPTSAVDLKQGCWIVSGDHLYLDGNVMWSDYGKPLEMLTNGSVITLEFNENRELHLLINDIDLGCFTRMTQRVNKLYPIIDIYGQCEQVSIINDNCDLPDFESQLSEGDLSENLSKENADFITLQPVINNENDGNNVYIKTVQLCEKAYLEYYEKEFNSLITVDDGANYSIQPSVSSCNFQIKEKNSRHRLSKSLSENESFNLAIQNISMTSSANASNEIKNREIKRRTTIVNCFQSYSLPYDKQNDWSSSIVHFNDKSWRNTFLKRSMTMQNLPQTKVKQSNSLENVSSLIPNKLKYLFKSDHEYFSSIVLHSELNNCGELYSDLKCENQQNPNLLKNINRKIFDKFYNQLAYPRKDVSEEDYVFPNRFECTLSILTLNTLSIRNFESLLNTDDYENYVETLFNEPNGDDALIYIQELFKEEHSDDVLLYIRELFKEKPLSCSLLNDTLLLINELNLPEGMFKNDSPQCFCSFCYQTEVASDIPRGWVCFNIKSSKCAPVTKMKRPSYWLFTLDSIQNLFCSNTSIDSQEAFMMPCEKLPSPDCLKMEMQCVDKQHKTGEMKAALQVHIWPTTYTDEMQPEDLYPTFSIQPLHYHIECIGYCQITALLIC